MCYLWIVLQRILIAQCEENELMLTFTIDWDIDPVDFLLKLLGQLVWPKFRSNCELKIDTLDS
jgi:hypothetical protein